MLRWLDKLFGSTNIYGDEKFTAMKGESLPVLLAKVSQSRQWNKEPQPPKKAHVR